MLDRIKTSRQIQIAVAAVVLVLLLVAAFLLLHRPPGLVVVGTTGNSAQLTDWTNRLDAAHMTPTIKQTGRSWQVKVLQPQKQAANAAMYIEAKPQVNTVQSACAALKPSSFDTSGQASYQTCEDQQGIHDMLVNRPDIVDAQVHLTEFENDALDSDTDMSAQAVVTITPAPGASINGRDLAETISQSDQGLSGSNIVITEINGSNTQKIWPQDQSASGGSCDQAETNDIYVRQSAIQSCMQQQITTLIMGLFPTLHPQVSALVMLSPTAQSQSVHQLISGVKTEINATKSEDSTSNDSSTEPSTTDTQSQQMAGFVERQNVSVLLPNATSSQMQAVKDLLSDYNSPKQHMNLTVDTTRVSAPAPVKTAPLPKPTTSPDAAAATSSSHTLTLLFALLVAALVAAVFWMWQKQQTLLREQTEFQNAFDRERASFATSDSDILARELEAFMGPAPSDAVPHEG